MRGETRSTTDSLLYAAARRGPALAESRSRPLRDWIFPVLNTSQNLFAELLVKQLGRRYGSAGSWDEGCAAELLRRRKDLHAEHIKLFADVDEIRWRGATPEFAEWAARMEAPRLVERAQRALEKSITPD